MSRRVAGIRAWASWALAAGTVIACACAGEAAAQVDVNPDAALMQQFEQRVAEYEKLRKSAEAALPPLKKPTNSPESIRHHEHELRKAIVARRPDAVQGTLFTPDIGAEFRRLIRIAYQADAKHIRESLLHGEPSTWNVRIRINRKYPDDRPIQSMPPSLLLNFPPLPPELVYRVVGRALILLDVGANLVVDVDPRVLPK